MLLFVNTMAFDHPCIPACGVARRLNRQAIRPFYLYLLLYSLITGDSRGSQRCETEKTMTDCQVYWN